ncbi:MAG TPA: SDR family oxidoreductase [Gemmatimonadales bacterium]|jgi:dehydrogenase/reductase SDR family protein 13
MAADDLAGRSFFVTGANSGIGRSMTEALAARGASIVLAARSEERTRPVLDGIRRQYPSSDVQWLQMDLADLDSVRRAAGAYLESGKPIDVLVNNAGIAGTNALSPQGFDVTYATNHIGPFLLTNLLLPRIREASQGRIVNVASSAHFTVKQMDWSTLERRTTPRRSGFPDYAMTKLMNVLHAKELARRLTGTAVTTYAVHPGAVATNIWRSLPGPVQWFIKLFMLSNEQGAVPLLHCATAPELASQTGRYYNRSRGISPSPLATDDNLARELWIRTEAIVGA